MILQDNTFTGDTEFTTNNIELSGGIAFTPTNIPASISYGNEDNIGIGAINHSWFSSLYSKYECVWNNEFYCFALWKICF
jgi:hypothetical protein